MGVDPNLVTGTPDAAIQHITDAELFGDPANLDRPALVSEDRVAGDDEQAGDLG